MKHELVRARRTTKITSMYLTEYYRTGKAKKEVHLKNLK